MRAVDLFFLCIICIRIHFVISSPLLYFCSFQKFKITQFLETILYIRKEGFPQDESLYSARKLLTLDRERVSRVLRFSHKSVTESVARCLWLYTLCAYSIVYCWAKPTRSREDPFPPTEGESRWRSKERARYFIARLNKWSLALFCLYIHCVAESLCCCVCMPTCLLTTN